MQIKTRLEEMAEKYYYKTYPVTLNVGEEERKKEVTDIFLAGLKAGRPQWHKVADEDLPTVVGRRFLVSNRYCTMIGYWNGKTFVSAADEDVSEIASPIAWCEIPKFNSED
jgi:hypothetical protein